MFITLVYYSIYSSGQTEQQTLAFVRKSTDICESTILHSILCEVKAFILSPCLPDADVQQTGQESSSTALKYPDIDIVGQVKRCQ